MSGIPNAIHNRLRETLLECGPFESNSQLRAVFTNDLLIPWRNQVPQGSSPSERVDLVINFLVNKRRADTKANALVIFLRLLSAQKDKADECHHSLSALADELERELSVASPAPTSHIFSPSGQVADSSVSTSSRQFPLAGPSSSSTQSSTSRATTTQQGSPAQKRGSEAGFAHGYALIVGIARYADTRIGRLSEAIVKDAMEMHTVLRSAELCGYQNDHVKILDNDEATAANIRDRLNWLAQVANADKEATALFYFSGHGDRVEIDEQVSHYLIPYDCNLDNLDGTALSGKDFAQLLHAIQAPRLLVVLDHCYSGGMDEIKSTGRGQVIFQEGLEPDYYQQLAQGQGRVLMASSRSTETSRSSSSLNNSLFTHYLLEALRGKAYTLGDGLLRVNDVYNYASAQVSQHRPQHAVMSTQASENFPIALYGGGKQTASSTISAVSVDQSALREAIVGVFSLEDLRFLCTDITQAQRRDGIDDLVSLDLLEGTGLRSKAQSLIEYCERRGRLSYLIMALCKARPNLDICRQTE